MGYPITLQLTIYINFVIGIVNLMQLIGNENNIRDNVFHFPLEPRYSEPVVGSTIKKMSILYYRLKQMR